ncbi:MAG TPA: GNAT family N-acetyltransferase [Bacteroidota bacterium]|nr:GNAT family N-acetyltransferase [Bacteroidota bacterium]
MDIKPVVLEGQYVRLEPLQPEHLPGLCDVGLDPELWRWTPTIVRTPDDMRAYVRTALLWQEQGTALPFVTIERSTGTIVGSTRFANIETAHMSTEIGWTWLGRRWQRTAINTEAKYLMLRHAFEVWGCIRVFFKTDSLNERSRTAIMRLGAQQEGVFRNHMLTHTGRIRHTVYFSIVNSEWSQIRSELEAKLQRL